MVGIYASREAHFLELMAQTGPLSSSLNRCPDLLVASDGESPAHNPLLRAVRPPCSLLSRMYLTDYREHFTCCVRAAHRTDMVRHAILPV